MKAVIAIIENNIGRKIPMLLHTIPMIANFFSPFSKRSISFNAIIPNMSPTIPTTIPKNMIIIARIESIPKTKEVIAFPFPIDPSTPFKSYPFYIMTHASSKTGLYK